MSETEEKAKTQSFSAEIGKVLNLMIHSLYTNRDIFLRELVSNASDACEKLQYLARTDSSLLKEDTELAIRIELDTKARTITVSDNGIGMNEDELISQLGTIARSGTQAFASQITGNKEKDVALIGQFGVGFYSLFMVADKVEVFSRKAGEESGWLWTSDGQGEFSVKKSNRQLPRGTSIIAHLREGKDFDAYLDRFRIQHIIGTYSDHISFPIYFRDDEDSTVATLNKGSALWTRPKAEISEEEYKEFYKHVSHLPDKPWFTMHNKVEGAFEYTTLLYIPSMRPFDLFHPDRMRRVKLYIKRVFITDEGVELIPPYLRFLRGVVDSQDLPLNISRETLQHSQMVEKIRSGITKRVISELNKKAEKEPDDYAGFWQNFGAVIKEGLCEALSDKEKILEICRFKSAASPEKTISMDEYITRMPAEQDAIYYIIGEDVESLRQSPQLEGFLKRGMDVLFFNDHVDSFWVNVVSQYKGKNIISVTKAKLKTNDDEVRKKADPTPEEAANEQAIDTLTRLLKEVYGSDEIKEVRTTAKLTDSPVCLAVAEGDMDIRMERFLVENKQLPSAAAKILEINPEHKVIKSLAEMALKDGKSEKFTDFAMLLLDQARVLEGQEVRNPAAFARRMTALMQSGM